MTVTGQSSLLSLFQTKVEEAVALVPGMTAEEKLKSIQFWNSVSGKLQDFVNNAADISALAMKLNDNDKEDVCDSLLSLTDRSNLYALNSENSNYLNSHDQTIGCTSDTLENSLKGDNFQLDNTSCASKGAVNSTENVIVNENSDLPSTSSSDSEVFQHSKEHLSINVPIQSAITNFVNNSGTTEKPQTNLKIVQRKSLEKQQYEGMKKFSEESYLLHLLTSSQSADAKFELGNALPNDICTTVNKNKESFCFSGSSIVLSSKEAVETDDLTENISDLACEWCDQNFSDILSLNNHKISHTKAFCCTECSAQFSCKANLMVHFRSHTGEKPYNCPLCPSKFSTRGNLKRHIRTHAGLRPHICSLCSSCFTEKKSLVVHMRRHTGEKPYECSICRKKFTQSSILQSHMAMHLNEKAHLCEHCGKAFRQKSQLRIHMLRHEGVRRYDCKQCSARFLIKGDLERHKRVHTGEKPYTCDICAKAFTRQQTLKEHMNRHYGLKPFKCKHCAKTFTEMSACYKHIKQHESLKEKDISSSSKLDMDVLQVENHKNSIYISSAETLQENSIDLTTPQSFTVIFEDYNTTKMEEQNDFIVETTETIKAV